MTLTPELRAQFSPVRGVFIEAAGKIQPIMVDAYAAAQRVFNLMEAEEQGMLGEVNEKAFRQDLNTIFMASGLTINDLVEAMRKSGFQVIITSKNKNF